MSTTEEHITYLQQIPAFALRQMVNESFPGTEGEAQLAVKMRTTLKRRPREVRKSVARLTRLELTQLISACEEIDVTKIAAYFEEYRYGSNPSFYIYLFDPVQLPAERMVDFDARLAQALVNDNARFSADVSRGLPPLCDVQLNDFGALPGASGLYEGTYRFLSRLDYIDADENVISTYETLYGFFWISVSDGYATIHARKPEVLKSLRLAIEEAAGVMLTHLVISKQFKNALNFLREDRFRSSRLYEPDPEATRFRSLTISDRRAYQKGYAQYEASYPELRSTSYRITVVSKETTVRLTCNQGAFSLAGRLQASEFRAWAIDTLGEVIRVLRTLYTIPTAYVETCGLRSSPALAAYPRALQKDLVLELLAHVLTLKQSGQQTAMLNRTAAELAITFQGDLAVQIPCTCTDPECEEESYLVCPVCEGSFFSLSEREGTLQIACQKRAEHWRATLPVEVELDCGHPGIVDSGSIRDNLEVLPNARLLSVMAQLVNNHLRDYQFDPLKEGFFIRGAVLHYYADKDAWLAVLPKGDGKGVQINHIIQNIQENYGDVIGVLQRQLVVSAG